MNIHAIDCTQGPFCLKLSIDCWSGKKNIMIFNANGKSVAVFRQNYQDWRARDLSDWLNAKYEGDDPPAPVWCEDPQDQNTHSKGDSMNDPISLLNVALATQRPEVMELFKREMANVTLTPEQTESLTTAIVNLFTEVYDLRRTVASMSLAERAISDALGGVQRQLEVSKLIAEKGRRGNLPASFSAPDIIRDVKKEMDRSLADSADD